MLSLDLSEVEPSVAGPKRPMDLVPLSGLKGDFSGCLMTEDAIRLALEVVWIRVRDTPRHGEEEILLALVSPSVGFSGTPQDDAANIMWKLP